MQVESLPLGDYQANCYVVKSEGEALVIDPGQASAQILQAVGDCRMRYVINTHGHPDHIGGDGFICEHYGAPLGFHPDDEKIFQFFMTDRLKPDFYLNENDEIACGDLRFRILHTPGHSPGSVTLWCESERVLFTGDLLFAGSIGRTDFPGGSVEDMNRSLQRVMDLEGDYTIYPGHGPPTRLEIERRSNPFLLELLTR
jgi:glyoxylase-like metal-dependent hydrolase (beta-lactamase superfamily II)